MATIVTAVCREGYEAAAGAKCPYLATSISSDAWAIGQWLNATGRCQPRLEVTKSRGDTYRVNDMLVSVKWGGGIPQIVRIN